ncbi:MAG TPA: VIT1/CCC1 transporter family protein [Candidatus Saccharimonadales bacterium]|nr:VIT1/CCC1 transporter family protein [Candidatus Saccharimonadales bacterium]
MAVQTLSKVPTESSYKAHIARHGHKLDNPLRDVILGGQDGLVNALGIILGILAAGGNIHILIATVMAANFAESISMGAVGYTSSLAQKDYYDSERAKEETEIEKEPEMEKEEIRRIYKKKGFSGKTLEEIVITVSSNRDNWVDLMMAEELNIAPVDSRDVLKTSAIITVATFVGHMVPLMPFFFVVGKDALIASIVASAVALFAVGAYQAFSLVGSWWKSGLRLVVIGLVAALIGYAIAKFFHVAA